jgi:hypothetical protein
MHPAQPRPAAPRSQPISYHVPVTSPAVDQLPQTVGGLSIAAIGPAAPPLVPPVPTTAAPSAATSPAATAAPGDRGQEAFSYWQSQVAARDAVTTPGARPR